MYGLEKDTRSINVGPTFILDYRVVDNCKSFYDKGGLRTVRFLVKNGVTASLWLRRLLKSEVSIASLFGQIQQPNMFSLEVKTITKSPGNGIAESKLQNSLVLKLKKLFQRLDSIQNSI